MNSIKSALFSGHRTHPLAAAVPQQQLGGAAPFHSTPVLQRKRKTQWHNRFNYYTRRRKNRETKRSMLRNMSEYAEYLFQSWRDEDEKNDASSGLSWFRGHRWWNSRRARSEKCRNWSSETETDEDDEVPAPSEVSLARQALGLSTSGPLKLDDVKSAYRACALRWHPDRHSGSSKATAEEKFKHCSAAYKTLCDSFAAA